MHCIACECDTCKILRLHIDSRRTGKAAHATSESTSALSSHSHCRPHRYLILIRCSFALRLFSLFFITCAQMFVHNRLSFPEMLSRVETKAKPKVKIIFSLKFFRIDEISGKFHIHWQFYANAI